MTALVTGGASGVGFVFYFCIFYFYLTSWMVKISRKQYVCGKLRYAIVEELASFGARIHVCDISETFLNQSLSEWEKKGFQVSGSICDATSRPQRETLIQKVSALFDGKLNILVSK